MRKIISIILIVALSLPSMYQFGVIVDFKLNQDYIAKVLCINKDKPIKKCNGKCHLAKQIQKTKSENEKEEPLAGNKLFQEFSYIISSADYLFNQYQCNQSSTSMFIDAYLFEYSMSIFQPPQVIA